MLTKEHFNALLRNDFAFFVRKCFDYLENKPLKWNWHLDAICDTLLQTLPDSPEQITRLIINIPPRSLKTTIATIAFPAWVLGKFPHKSTIALSYSKALSLEHSVKCRRIVESDWFMEAFPNCRLAPDQNEKGLFQTTQHGGRFCTSVGGSLTGKGGDYIILDDPQNPAIANSQAEREASNEWVKSTVFSRLNDKQKGVIIVIMQRLHEEDTTGMLLQLSPDWHTLILPAVNDSEAPLKFKNKTWQPAELLHPEELTEKYLAEQANVLGSYGFAGQYMQRPVPKDGAIFKREWFKYYSTIPGIREVVQTWDTAYKAEQHNDPSVCITWGINPEGLYILDVFRARLNYPELLKAVYEQARIFNVNTILIEDKASGQSLIQELRLKTRLPIIGLTPHGDKVTRAIQSTRYFESGKILLPKEAPWLASYEAELLQFPKAKHDDQVDATSMMLSWFKEDYFEQLKNFDQFENMLLIDDDDYSMMGSDGRSSYTGY